MVENNNYQLYTDILIFSICGDIKKARDSKILAGSVILTLSAIDAMAFLAMPLSETEVTKKSFIDWVNKYMKTDINQQYKYEGIDLYGARCGIVHRYGTKSGLSEKGQCKILAYHDGTEHMYNSKIKDDFVLISFTRFIDDFFLGVRDFIKDIITLPDLKQRVDHRITSLFRIIPANGERKVL